MAGIVEEGLQCHISQKKENVRFKEEKKKRLRKKPRETAMRIEVDVVGPCDCAIDDDSQELEGVWRREMGQ